MKVNENPRVILGCLIAGLLGGLAIATSWKLKSDKDFWDVVSAVGTMAAAVIALGIALRDGMRRAKADHNKAVIVASRVSVKLDAMVSIAEWIDLCLEQMPRDVADRSRWYDHVFGHVESELPEIPIDDLAALEALSHDCGQLISKGTAALGLVREDIARCRVLFGKTDIPTASLVSLVSNWRGKVAQSLEPLNEANRVCRKFGR